MRVQIDRVTVESVEVDFPDACPTCGASFTDPDDCALVRYDLREQFGDAWIDWRKTPKNDGTLLRRDDSEDGDGEVWAVGVMIGCSRCTWIFAGNKPEVK